MFTVLPPRYSHGKLSNILNAPLIGKLVRKIHFYDKVSSVDPPSDHYRLITFFQLFLVYLISRSLKANLFSSQVMI